MQVAAGMEFLHENNLVHGELKPQNILLQTSPSGGFPEARSLLPTCPPSSLLLV
jgi:serine/threonine protein kinase